MHLDMDISDEQVIDLCLALALRAEDLHNLADGALKRGEAGRTTARIYRDRGNRVLVLRRAIERALGRQMTG